MPLHKTREGEQLADLIAALGLPADAPHGTALDRIAKIQHELAALYQATALLRQANERLTQQGQQAAVLFGQMKAKIDEQAALIEELKGAPTKH